MNVNEVPSKLTNVGCLTCVMMSLILTNESSSFIVLSMNLLMVLPLSKMTVSQGGSGGKTSITALFRVTDAARDDTQYKSEV